MNLQFFAEPEGTGVSEQQAAGDQGQQAAPAAGGQPGARPEADYSKIKQMLDGAMTAKEDAALKSYFKQQGLSEAEMQQAIAAFKQQKAAQQPDVGELQAQAAEALAASREATLEKEATLAAVGLRLDPKTIPYVLKMADLGGAIGEDGKINGGLLKGAINKVLEEVPALKPQPAGQAGFIQVGTTGGAGQQAAADDEALKKAFGL